MTRKKPVPEVAAEQEIRSPQNLDSERVILGALIECETMLPEVIAAGLESDAFYLSDHRRVFAAMLALHEKHAPIDSVTVNEEIGNTDSGWALLADLISGVVIERSHILYHVGIVRKKARLRKLQELAEWITVSTSEIAADPALIVAATVQRAEVLA